ncbi:MAG: hypothetical protein JJU11_04350 [Candidatus Sumerlaeia bacterium]|nr:hypothetical protein [Candidatus Sumerlaeia bacterium]
MKKTILIQTLLVVFALILLIFMRFNQPPFEYIPTTIHLSGEGQVETRVEERTEPTPRRQAPSREEQQAPPQEVPEPEATTETNYQ